MLNVVRRAPNWELRDAFHPLPKRLFSVNWTTPKILSTELYPSPPDRVPVGPSCTSTFASISPGAVEGAVLIFTSLKYDERVRFSLLVFSPVAV